MREIANIAKVLESDPQEMRKVFNDTMIEMAKADRDIILLDADLMAAMGTKPFAVELPNQTINCGIQEGNMVCVAAGLSSVGKKPYVHTFGVFSTRRANDQISISCAYSKQNLKIIGSDAGVTASLNGGTHMSFEDLGNMRIIPDMTVIDPTDNVMLKSILKDTKDLPGMFYIRLVRKNITKIYEEGNTFEIGKAKLLRDGNDVTIIAEGVCVEEALKASAELEKKGVSAAVIDMFTIKPIDRDIITEYAKKTKAIVTVENHSIYNGLGSAVAEVLAENEPADMERLGAKKFGAVGFQPYLTEYFEISSPFVVQAAEKVLARRKAR